MEAAFDCVYEFYGHCHMNKQYEIDGMALAYDWICHDGLDGKCGHGPGLHQYSFPLFHRFCSLLEAMRVDS